MTAWIATALGVAGGLALSYALGRAVLPALLANSRDKLLMGRLAIAGIAVALLPALFLSLVVGGTLGSAWGEHTFRQLGLPSSGMAFGLASGIALVFALVLLGGAGIGLLFGKAWLSYRQWRGP